MPVNDAPTILRPDVARALRSMADGTPDTLINLSALRALEKLGYVAWSESGHYGRVLTDEGRRAALEAA